MIQLLYQLGKPVLFSMDPERAHELTLTWSGRLVDRLPWLVWLTAPGRTRTNTPTTLFGKPLAAPVGLAAGPLAGLAKGVALDVQVWILGDMTYDKAFNSYRSTSIWRPYTIHW